MIGHIATLRKVAALLGAAALLLAAPGAVAQQPARVPEKPRTGHVEVTVEMKTGGSVPALTLYLGEQRAELAAGKTTHRFENVTAVRRALTGDALVPASGASGAKRYVGVQLVNVVPNRTAKATLTLEEVGSMEDFCRRCHPDSPTDVEQGQILRDRHVSGIALEEKHLGPVAKYNARVEELRKAGKPHNQPIILEKRVVVEGGKKVERLFSTCESCHTLHWARDEQKYARALFKKRGNLCRGCHL